MHMPAKANKGGALLFISNELNYNVKNSWEIYQDKNLESIFIDVISKSQKNKDVDCIYKLPNLGVTELLFAATSWQIISWKKRCYTINEWFQCGLASLWNA